MPVYTRVGIHTLLVNLDCFQRLAVFKWMAAVAVDLNQVAGKEGLETVLKFFVSPLTRDINDDGSPKEVKDLAHEVSELIKGTIISCLFNFKF
jgi:hypothetical protein